MDQDKKVSRRDLLTASAATGGLLTLGSAGEAAMQDRQVGGGREPAKALERRDDLKTFEPPRGKVVSARDGYAAMTDIAQTISIGSASFEFKLPNGQYTEKTVAVTRPPGAGFTVMVQSIYAAFVNTAGGSTLVERPLGQFVVTLGMRGDNLVCGVRLTDRNADDPVSITIHGAVLFFK